MNRAQEIFGAGWELAGWFRDPELDFTFEVWSRTGPVSDAKVQAAYLAWRQQDRRNVPARGRKIQVQVNQLKDLR